MPGSRIVILGSGDIGLIMARRMTFEGAEVVACVELMPYSSGLTRNVVQCLHDFDIPLLLSHTVVDIHGLERLEGVTIAAVDPETRRPLPETATRIDCDALLLSVGLIPENELSRQADVTIADSTRGPVVDQNLATDVPGIYACGNVLHVHDLVDEVSAEAARAGQAAFTWLTRQNELAGKAAAVSSRPQLLNVIEGRGVRGLVPQYLDLAEIRKNESGELSISFRTDQVYKQAAAVIRCQNTVLARQKKLIMTPGEMVLLKLDPSRLPPHQAMQDLVVSVEGEAEYA